MNLTGKMQRSRDLKAGEYQCDRLRVRDHVSRKRVVRYAGEKVAVVPDSSRTVAIWPQYVPVCSEATAGSRSNHAGFDLSDARFVSNRGDLV
jgi:hypothetical protein